MHCYIPKTELIAPGCLVKEQTTLGGPYRQYDYFLMYLDDSFLSFDIAFKKESAASIFMVT